MKTKPKTKEVVCYKLTDQENKTHGGFQWTPERWMPKLSGKGGLCSDGFYHAYHHPLLAEFLNPIHADLRNPILWEAMGRGKMEDDNGIKCGFAQMKIVRKIELANPTAVQRVCFAMLCAKEVYKEKSFVEFADKYLSGEDRSGEAAWAVRAAAARAWAAMAAAVRAAAARAWAAAEAAAWAAAWAAEAAEPFQPKLIAAAEAAMKCK